jgi:hypothetical membrane protein
MQKNRNLSLIASIVVVTGYLVFTLISFWQFPTAYSPIHNWLSDLGDVTQNPHGAIFYNIGIILTGLALIVVFIGLSCWKMKEKTVQVIMLRLSQGFGILGALCMVMSAIFPINLFAVHKIWSALLYIMLSTAFVFSSAALRYYPKVSRVLLVLGIITAGLVISTAFLTNVHILEWITVPIMLIYIRWLGTETKSLCP